MSINIFFNSIPESQLQTWASKDSLFESIDYHFGQFPNWEDADIAIFSLSDSEDPQSEEITNNWGALRKSFAQLSHFSRECKVADLGFLRLGDSLQNTQQRISEVCEALMTHDTLPIFLADNQVYGYGQFMGYQYLEKLISIVNVDARIDLQDETAPLDKQFLHQILSHHPNYLFDYNHLGYQRFLNMPKLLNTLSQLNFLAESVGVIKKNIQETEPVVRLADLFMFDVSALRLSEVPATQENSPFGLTGEDACQICWYAGLNEKLSSFGLYNFPAHSPDKQTARVGAIMLWYFIEGFSHRKAEYSFKSNFHVKYLVPLQNGSQTLTFYKSKTTEKWWLEVGVHQNADHTYERSVIVPCSYADYETANHGELPERWLRAQDKLSD